MKIIKKSATYHLVLLLYISSIYSALKKISRNRHQFNIILRLDKYRIIIHDKIIIRIKTREHSRLGCFSLLYANRLRSV